MVWQADGLPVLDADAIIASLDAVAQREPAFARAIAQIGYPAPRIRETGYRTLLRTIVGQQVSVAAANSVWAKLEAQFGADMPVEAVLASDDDTLRACGLSRQKQSYARSLCALVASGELDLAHLPDDDEAAIAELTRIKGIGRWSAEIYLLFAEGRPDIWPAGDLGVRVGITGILDLPERPPEKEVRALADSWRPHRSAVTLFSWHFCHNPTL